MNGYDKVEYVKVDKILDHPEVPNIRAEVTKADVKELMASILQSGIQNPLTCFVIDGKHYLVSGWRRRKAVQEILKDDPKHELSKGVPVLTKKYNAKTVLRDALYDNMVENIQRKDVNPLDQANRIKKLIDEDIGKQEICAKIGKSITWLNDVLRVLEADEEVRKKIKSGEITMSDAKNIAKLPQKDQKQVAKGLAAARTSGNREATKKIKKSLDEATRVRSHSAPTKKEIKYQRNVLFEVLRVMKQRKEDDNKVYYILEGCFNMLEWALGFRKDPDFTKYTKKYGIKIGDDGKLVTEEKTKKKKKSAKKTAKKKKK